MIGETMTVSAIVGFLMPLAIAALLREKWGSTVKALTAFALCLIAALVVTWFEAAVNWRDARGVILVVFGTAIFSYQHYWKPSGATDALSRATG